MKNLLLLLLLGVVFFTSCKKDDENVKRDYRSLLWIYGNDNYRTNKAVDQKRMKVHEILTGDSLVVRFSNIHYSGFCKYIADGSIDTIHDRISFVAGNLNDIHGNTFLYDTMMFIEKEPIYGGLGDTVGYIPSEQIVSMREKLFELWDSGDWNTIYKTFEDGLQFVPCTGAEYKQIHGLE